MIKITAIILACLACILVMAAGCTGTSSTATPAVTVTAVTPASAASDSWSGTWDTAGSTTIAYQTYGVLTLTRTGPSVTGTFSNNDQGKGSVNGTIMGNQLAGTWTTDYPLKSDSGSFVFVLSDDKTHSPIGGSLYPLRNIPSALPRNPGTELGDNHEQERND
jgi:hypothetical protein